MAIKFNIKSNALTHYGRIIDSAQLHKDFNLATAFSISDPAARKHYIYTYGMLSNVDTFSQSDFDEDYYRTIMATDPSAAASYIGYKAMGERDDELEEMWANSREHYYGEYKRLNSTGGEKFVAGMVEAGKQVWYTLLNIVDTFSDGLTSLAGSGARFLDRLDRYGGRTNPLNGLRPPGMPSTGFISKQDLLDKDSLNARLDEDRWAQWAIGDAENIDDAMAKSKIDAYYNAGWYDSIEDALDGPTDFLSGGSLSGADIFELLLSVTESIGLMSLNMLGPGGSFLYWSNVAMGAIDESRNVDSDAGMIALAAAKFGIEYISEKIFVDSYFNEGFFSTGFVNAQALSQKLVGRPIGYLAAKIGTEIATNAIEEMVAETMNIALDWAIYSIAGNDLNGTLTTSDGPEIFERILGAGISGALIGLFGGGKEAIKGISKAKSFTTESGEKVSRLQSYAFNDFFSSFIENIDGEYNVRKVVDEMRAKGMTDAEIKATKQYKDALKKDTKNQIKFVDNMAKVQKALADMGMDRVQIENVNATTLETFGKMKTQYYNYYLYQNTDDNLGVTDEQVKKQPNIAKTHKDKIDVLKSNFGDNFNFAVVDSSLINEDLGNIAKNTGYDNVIVFDSGSKDGSRMKSEVFQLGDTLYVEANYYKNNFGSRASLIRDAAAAKLISNLVDDVGMVSNLEFYERLSNAFPESKGAYGHYFFLDLVQKHGIEEAKKLVLKAITSSPKLMNSIYVTNKTDADKIVLNMAKLAKDFTKVKESGVDADFIMEYVRIYNHMVNNMTDAVLSEIGSYDNKAAQAIRKVIKDTPIEKKAEALLKVMNSHRDNILKNATTFQVGLMRALGFTEIHKLGDATVELVKEDVVNYVNSLGAAGLTSAKVASYMANVGNEVTVESMAAIIMSDPQLQVYLAHNVKGFNERFIMGLRAVLMDSNIRDKGPALSTLAAYIRRVYSLAPKEIKESMLAMIKGIKLSLTKQGFLTVDGVPIQQEMGELEAVDLLDQAKFDKALSWVVPVETDGRDYTKIIKATFPALLKNVKSIEQIYDILIGKSGSNSVIFEHIMKEVLVNGKFDAETGEGEIPLLSILGALGIAGDAISKDINNASLLFVEKLFGVTVSTDLLTENYKVKFDIRTLDKGRVSRALSEATGYVLSNIDDNITALRVVDIAPFIKFDLDKAKGKLGDNVTDGMSDGNIIIEALDDKTKLSDIVNINKLVSTLPLTTSQKKQVRQKLNDTYIIKQKAVERGSSFDYSAYLSTLDGNIRIVANNKNYKKYNMFTQLIHEVTHAISNAISPNSVTSSTPFFNVLTNHDTAAWGVIYTMSDLINQGKVKLDAVLKGNRWVIKSILVDAGIKDLTSNEFESILKYIVLVARYNKLLEDLITPENYHVHANTVYETTLAEIIARKGSDRSLVNLLTPELFTGTEQLQLVRAIDKAILELPSWMFQEGYTGKTYSLSDKGIIPVSLFDKLFAKASDPKFESDKNAFKGLDFYHGTHYSFDEFDPEYSGRASGQQEGGFFFTTKTEAARLYGDVYKHKLYAEKPFIYSKDMSVSDKKIVMDAIIRRMLKLDKYKTVNNAIKALNDDDFEFSDDTYIYEFILSSPRKRPTYTKDIITKLVQKAYEDSFTTILSSGYVKEVLFPILKKNGYDAYVGPHLDFKHDTEYVVFNPNQVGFYEEHKPLSFSKYLLYSLNTKDSGVNARMAALSKLDKSLNDAFSKYKGEDKSEVRNSVYAVQDMATEIAKGNYNTPDEIAAFVEDVRGVSNLLGVDLTNTFDPSKLVIEEKAKVVKKQVDTKKQAVVKPEVKKPATQEAPKKEVSMKASTIFVDNDVVVLMNKVLAKARYLANALSNLKEGEQIDFTISEMYELLDSLVKQISKVDVDNKDDFVAIAKKYRSEMFNLWDRYGINKTTNSDYTTVVGSVGERILELLNGFAGEISALGGGTYEAITPKVQTPSPSPEEVKKAKPEKTVTKVGEKTPVKKSKPEKTVTKVEEKAPVKKKVVTREATKVVPELTLIEKTTTIRDMKISTTERLPRVARRPSAAIAEVKESNRRSGAWLVKKSLVANSATMRENFANALSRLENKFNIAFGNHTSMYPSNNNLSKLSRMVKAANNNPITSDAKFWKKLTGKTAEEFLDYVRKEVFKHRTFVYNLRATLKYGDPAKGYKPVVFNSVAEVDELNRLLDADESFQYHLRKLNEIKQRLDIFFDAYKAKVIERNNNLSAEKAIERAAKINEQSKAEIEKLAEEVEALSKRKKELKREVAEAKEGKEALEGKKISAYNLMLNEYRAIADKAKKEGTTLSSFDDFVLNILEGNVQFGLMDDDEVNDFIYNLAEELSVEDIYRLDTFMNKKVAGVSTFRRAIKYALRNVMDLDEVEVAKFDKAVRKAYNAAKNAIQIKLKLGALISKMLRGSEDGVHIGPNTSFRYITSGDMKNVYFILSEIAADEVLHNTTLMLVKEELDALAGILLANTDLYNAEGYLLPQGKFVRNTLLELKGMYERGGLDLPEALDVNLMTLMPNARKVKGNVTILEKETDAKPSKRADAKTLETIREAGKVIDLSDGAQNEVQWFLSTLKSIAERVGSPLDEVTAEALEFIVKYSSFVSTSSVAIDESVAAAVYNANLYSEFVEIVGPIIDSLSYAQLLRIVDAIDATVSYDITLPTHIASNLSNLLRYLLDHYFPSRVAVENGPDGASDSLRRIKIRSKLNRILSKSASQAGQVLGKRSRSINIMDNYGGNTVTAVTLSLVEYYVENKGMSRDEAIKLVRGKLYSLSLKDILDSVKSDEGRNKLYGILKAILSESNMYKGKNEMGIEITDESSIDDAIVALIGENRDLRANAEILQDLYDAAMDLGEYGIISYIDNIFYEEAANEVANIGGIKDLVRDLREKKLTPEERKEIWNQIGKRVIAFRYMSLLSNPSVYVKNLVMNKGNSIVNAKLVDPITKFFRKILDKMIGDKFTTKGDKVYIMDSDGNFLNYDYSGGNWVYGNKTTANIGAKAYTREQAEKILKMEGPKTTYYIVNADNFTQLQMSVGTKGGKTSERAKKFVREKLLDTGHLDMLLGGAGNFARGLNEKTFDKYVAKINPYNTRGPINKGLNKLHTFMYNALEGADMKSIRALTIRYLEQLVEANKIYDVDIRALDKYVYNDMMSKYIQIAVAESLSVVFKSETKALKMLHNIYDNNKYARFIGNMILPFSRVSFNVIHQLYEYSPLGLTKTIIDILTIRRKGYEVDINNITERMKLEGLSKGLAKGVIGSAVYVLGFVLGAMGFIRLDEEKDYNGYVVYVGDVMINISSITTLSAPLLLGASLSGGIADGDSFGEVIEDFTQQYLNATFLGNLLDTARVYNASTIPLDILEDYVASYVPSVFKSMTRWFTNAERQYAQGGWKLSWFKRVLQRAMPWFAEKRIDPYTGETDYLMEEGIAGNLLNLFNSISPFQVYKYDYSPEQKLMREHDLTVGTSTNFKLTFNGEDVEMSAAQRNAYNKERASAFKYLVREVQKSQAWKKANKDERKKILEGIKSASSTFAKTKMWLDVNKSNTYQYTKGSAYGDLMAKYYKNSRIRRVSNLSKAGINYYGKWL